MAKIKVPAGSKITVGIEGPKPSTAQKPADPKFAGAEPTDEQLYVFRKKEGITVYDLGTRKNPDDTYHHVDFGTATSAEGGIDTVGRDRYHTALLTSDIRDSLQLPQSSQYVYVDLIFRQGEEVRRILVGAANKRPYVAEPAGENVAETNWKSGSGKFSGGGQWSVAAETGFFFNPFDTGDTTNFKVTASAGPLSDAVPFAVSASDKFQIYLTPRIYISQIGGAGDSTQFLGRLPVLPSFDPVKEPIFSSVTAGDESISGAIVEAYFAAYNNYFLTLNPEHVSDWSSTVDQFNAYTGSLIGPTLAAIIVKNNQAFYVWRVALSNNKWVNSQITHSG